jgi:two-component system cell cycle sensor histidine kinase/response regulator CckA
MSVSALSRDPFLGVAAANDSWLGAWETSADAAYCRDPGGRILAVNLSFARKFGRAAAALAEASVKDLIHPDDLSVLLASEAALGRPPYRSMGEHRWCTPQGVRWFAWEESAIHGEAGVIVAIRAVGRDITRQRLAEEQFYRLSRAVEQSPVSIVITDLDGRPQYVNSKFTAVSGHTLEDLLDNDIEVLRDGHPDEASVQRFWAMVRAGGEWRGELATRRGDGGTVWESVKVSPLRSPAGEITNFLCLREDVSERKRLEHELRQAQKMESLGTLAGGIAHDFNNLLAIINGYAEFCQQGNTEPAVLEKSLREIHRAAQRASGLVRQILTFSRKTEVRFSPVDFNQLSRELVALLAETFPRTVTFQISLLDSLPPLLADQNQLQQIVLNLCVNARDAMPQGGTISLTTGLQPGAGLERLGGDPARAYACLQVGDTGTGMSPEVRARIFEPFFTTKQGNQGTGLGLAVVYGIVVAHHGFIDVESTPGAGSTFRVYLPLAENVHHVPAIIAPVEIFPTGTETILIVDDEESLRVLLSTALSRKGYRTLTAASGLDAIEIIGDTHRKFDLVLLDLNMPGATGVEVLKIIRICRPQMKVMVVSGHITPTARAEFEQLGQRDFVQKPYRLDELGRTLRRLLDAKPTATA